MGVVSSGLYLDKKLDRSGKLRSFCNNKKGCGTFKIWGMPVTVGVFEI